MTKNKKLQSWVEEAAALCQPDSIYWCDGSQEENDRLCEELVQNGTFVRLDPEKRPGSYLARSSPADVARVEEPNIYLCKNPARSRTHKQLARSQ